MTVSRLYSIAQRHVPHGWRDPDDEQTRAAVAALREISTHPVLLAEAAGILIGGSATTAYARYARIAGTFCILAGADESLLPGWIATGMERRERADRVTAWQDWEPGGVAG